LQAVCYAVAVCRLVRLIVVAANVGQLKLVQWGRAVVEPRRKRVQGHACMLFDIVLKLARFKRAQYERVIDDMRVNLINDQKNPLARSLAGIRRKVLLFGAVGNLHCLREVARDEKALRKLSEVVVWWCRVREEGRRTRVAGCRL
jgi:hypothetical protein